MDQTNPPAGQTPVLESVANSHKGLYASIAVVVVFILAFGGYLLYANVLKPKAEARARAEKLAVLDQKIAAAGQEYVSLTTDEYDLLLSRPVQNPAVKGITGTTSGITVGFDGSEISAAFAKIPNVDSSKEVFIRLDSIKKKDGTEVFDAESSFEADNDMFTDLDLDKRSSGTTPYWMGARDVHLTDGNYTLKASDVASVSGKIIFNLPTNIQILTLTAADKGIEKAFGGGFVTLEDITDTTVTYSYSGFPDDFYAETGVDANGKEVYVDDYNCSNGTCEMTVDHAVGYKFYVATIVPKEYPFTIQAAGVTPATVKTAPVAPVSTTVEPKTQEMPAVASSGSVTAEEKNAVIAAYFSFEKILDSKDANQFLAFIKKAYPDRAAEAQAEFDKDPDIQKNFAESVSMFKMAMGYGDVTDAVLRSTKAQWSKDDDSSINIEVTGADEDSTNSLYFKKVAGVWYVDFD